MDSKNVESDPFQKSNISKDLFCRFLLLSGCSGISRLRSNSGIAAQSLPAGRQAAIPFSLCLIFLTVFSSAFSQQRQLIVLKNEEVLARYQKGDAIHFARAGEKEIQIQRILDMNDTLLMMNMDSVAYYRIARLDIRARKSATYAQRLGMYMMVAGVILPLAELLNTGVIQNDEPSVSSGVWVASGVLVGGGAILAFVKKPYFKPGRKFRLMIVDDRSPFYKVKPVQEGYTSPLIPKN